MAPTQTREWIVANPPKGEPVYEGENATFKIKTVDLPEVGDNQVLVKTLYLSNDPAQRGWIQAGIDPERLYTAPVLKNEAMRCFAVSQVVKSKSDQLKDGQIVYGQSTWTEYAVLDASAVRPIDEKSGIKATHYLGGVGATGLTAYYGLVDVGGAKEGETVVVSGAAGATGSMVVQIAKHLVGAKRVIGIAGGEKKCRWVESLGADVCIDYKAPDFKEQLLKVTEGFVDVYFDNVGGEILDLMLTRVKRFGRIIACGAVSTYNSLGETGIKNWFEIVANRLEIRGFIVTDAFTAGKAPGYIGKIVEGVKAGKLKIGADSETVVPTKFEDIPKTWNSLFTGGNQGKLITDLTA
ncbi:NAD(P)-binding protein [Massarina eburnea CBS 473.64]|uniref:NAD(P)-binding protein n=1 Tax=Massarina eburnea CBS 473.64 TaxID=1395130 RepID=A0A6A6RSB6_9PLEO|nr:NAD(P)-binding protein [Massarina eburnea CBS 473.64]